MAESRILIVDDDRTMLESLAETVRECGYEPLTAQSWSDALRVFRQDSPSLVMLDVMMPTVDGFKLARIIKGEVGDEFVPVILITGLDDVESKRRGLAAGADDFLIKPVTQVELQIRLNSLLRIKELTDQLRAANALLADLASVDPLTQVKNRRVLYEQLEREFARAKRYDHALSVLMIDIDHFKRVNDDHGHGVGDEVLRRVAEALRITVRNTDLVARYGGEEFVVIAPETPIDSAAIMADRLRAAVTSAIDQVEGVGRVTISVGIASTESLHATHFEDLIHLADGALYRAKKAGRDRCELT